MTCSLCGTPGARFLFERRKHAFIQHERPFVYYGCGRCGVRFQPIEERRVDPYLEEKQVTAPDAPDAARGYLHWDRDIARALWRRLPGGRLLDFGSGWGDMLTAAREVGYQAEGLDISPELARQAKARSGCPVFVGALTDAGYPPDAFRVINAHFVLEYVHDLTATVREMARLLEPGGLLRVCAYTWDSLPARLRGERWWNYAPMREYVFSTRTWQFLAETSGLTLSEVIVGAEQSLASYLAERHRPTPLTSTLDLGRYYLRNGLAFTSCRAFYLEKPASG